ncbi:MAG: TldD/PmbA family protein [Clostridia bacterium]|nr:TldD/PmbA family protein [Clostridia bacterium]
MDNSYKTVRPSAYLEGIKPALRKLGAALEKEYEYYSILAADNHSRTYSVSAGGVSASADQLQTGRGIVVRVRDVKGFAEYSFDEFSEKEIDAVQRVIRDKITGMRDKLNLPGGELERGALTETELRFSKSTEYLIHPEELGDKGIIDRITALRTKGLSMAEGLLDCAVRVSYQEVHKIFLSKKRDLEQNYLWTVGGATALARRGQEIKDAYGSVSGLGGAEILDGLEEKLQSFADTAVMLLKSEPMVPGTYDCVCTPDVTGMIAHEAFGHGVEMDMFVKDRALAKEYIGKQVASELVTMHDGGSAAAQTGSYFFDDEGVEAHDTVIIEKGILKRGICDTLSALALGSAPTGNGRRQDFAAKAYTRMTNTFFEGGNDSLEDMIASIDYGFMLENPTSGMEDPKNWGIQCMVSHAREIKSGKFTGRVLSPVVLTGYVPDLLKSISMMSPNVELSGSGMCGKGYKEFVKVSDGGPYIKARIRLG